MLGTIIGFEIYNHEKMVKISKLFVEPYVPRVWEYGKIQFVKMAAKFGLNTGNTVNFGYKWLHIRIFSQCKKMEGWNFNVLISAWKKFVIAAPVQRHCRPVQRHCRPVQRHKEPAEITVSRGKPVVGKNKTAAPTVQRRSFIIILLIPQKLLIIYYWSNIHSQISTLKYPLSNIPDWF